MGHHSIAETKNKLSELVDRARAGEKVVVTRHGQPVIEFHPVEQAPRKITKQDLEWLAERRRGRGRADVDSGTLLSRMRDEDWR